MTGAELTKLLSAARMAHAEYGAAREALIVAIAEQKPTAGALSRMILAERTSEGAWNSARAEAAKR